MVVDNLHKLRCRLQAGAQEPCQLLLASCHITHMPRDDKQVGSDLPGEQLRLLKIAMSAKKRLAVSPAFSGTMACDIIPGHPHTSHKQRRCLAKPIAKLKQPNTCAISSSRTTEPLLPERSGGPY